MATPTQDFIASFVARVQPALATLARELSGALAAGDESLSRQLTYKGELLRQGLTSVTTPTNRLSDEQRLYIVEKLLGLLPAVGAGAVGAAPAVPPVLTLNPLPARVRGQVEADVLTLTGTLSGTLPVGAQLILSRNGRELSRQPARAGRYTFTDPTPGLRYQVELSGTALLQQRSRPLVSPVLFGTGPAGAGAAYLATLPGRYPGFVNGVGRFAATGERNRLLLLVPLSQGRVELLTQPDDQDADISMAFTRRTVSLDFGPDGSDQYEVLENYANFLGPFTLDAHLK